MTVTVLASAPASSGTRRCRWCHLPIMRCPVLAEGYLTYCGGWVHVPPAPGRFGRHSCEAGKAATQAAPEKPGRENDD